MFIKLTANLSFLLAPNHVPAIAGSLTAVVLVLAVIIVVIIILKRRGKGCAMLDDNSSFSIFIKNKVGHF